MSQDTYISHYLGSMVVCSNWWNKRSMCLLYVCCTYILGPGGEEYHSLSLSLSLFSLWECACSITLCMDLIFLLGSLTCQKYNIVPHPFQRSWVYHVPTYISQDTYLSYALKAVLLRIVHHTHVVHHTRYPICQAPRHLLYKYCTYLPISAYVLMSPTPSVNTFSLLDSSTVTYS